MDQEICIKLKAVKAAPVVEVFSEKVSSENKLSTAKWKEFISFHTINARVSFMYNMIILGTSGARVVGKS